MRERSRVSNGLLARVSEARCGRPRSGEGEHAALLHHLKRLSGKQREASVSVDAQLAPAELRR
jgi:hypothetical protein